VKVPTGFATTAHAFREFLKHDGLTDRINARLDALDTEDVRALADAGAQIRGVGRGAAVSGRPGDGDP
jgi:pyruvate,water dikinase